jgi:hypothetical protein
MIRALTRFLAVSAVMELGAGLTLLVAPALAIRLVFGSSETAQGVALGRVAGAALLSLGAACWGARLDSGGTGARALVRGMLIYNALVVALVVTGSLGSVGPLLRGVAVLHGTMALWCVLLLRGGRSARVDSSKGPAA